MTIKDNSFVSIRSENLGSQGGAIYSSIHNSDTMVEITNNTFEKCRAAEGGAVLWDYHEPLLFNNTFIEN